ncbi:hypothetical protein HBZC1_08560 [Helicobacter bizzozeronii CIII-1]|uniref:Uncharacterized protein n=1 Tax=Helicobacter bizzozeronii (strain CIII-1) TaxID=1002804 RepID=F8KSR1_HELBC|nr:hypothetical protein [Helicobacter bizzozeronii]CCB79842.1 hypothetical protein HBZC1_08560 [Helicobacter bizzozeronii CIII-1]
MCAGQGLFVQDNGEGHLVPKSVALVEQVSTELLAKAKISLVVFMGGSKDLATKEQRQIYQENKLKTLHAPFVALFAYYKAQKIEIVANPTDLLDKDKIFFEHMAPFLPKKWGENEAQNNARFSFALLNGYTYMAEALSKARHVNLESNIKEDSPNSFIKTTLYILLCSLLALFFYAYFFGSKKSQ